MWTTSTLTGELPKGFAKATSIDITDVIMDDVYNILYEDPLFDTDNKPPYIDGGIILNLNLHENGRIEIFGVNGHPVDYTKKIKMKNSLDYNPQT